eukprot:232724-Rhodomonas_salina.1
MPPGRASYSVTPATDSTSTPQGRARRQDQAPGKTCQRKVLFTQGSARIFNDDRRALYGSHLSDTAVQSSTRIE